MTELTIDEDIGLSSANTNNINLNKNAYYPGSFSERVVAPTVVLANARVITHTDVPSWKHVLLAGSSFDANDNLVARELLINTQNSIFQSSLLDDLKDYEHDFGMSSDDFIHQWSNGDILPSPEGHAFVNTHRILFGS